MHGRAAGSAPGTSTNVPPARVAGQDSSKRRYRTFRESLRSGAPMEKDGQEEHPKRGGWRYLGEYRKLVRRHTPAIVLVFVLALIGALLGLVLPYATKLVIDEALLNPALSAAEKAARLSFFGLSMVGLILLM